MKKIYIKPTVEIVHVISDSPFMENSEGNFGAGIGEGEGTFETKEDQWEDFDFGTNLWETPESDTEE